MYTESEMEDIDKERNGIRRIFSTSRGKEKSRTNKQILLLRDFIYEFPVEEGLFFNQI